MKKSESKIDREFKQLIHKAKLPGARGGRAWMRLAQLTRQHPRLVDEARLHQIKLPGAHTRELPLPPAAAKEAARKRSHLPKAATVKPSYPTTQWPAAPPKGYKWMRCGKNNCHCMKGGAWHGPYRYRSERQGDFVRSFYEGKYTE